MDVGKIIAAACSSFAITNIDDIFVLVTFFSESSTSNSTITPLQITIGQYLGFIVIVSISLIGYGASFIMPTEPIGFLGLVPICIGISKLIELILHRNVEEVESLRDYKEKIKNVIKIASITVSNGGDNISIYVPLFSQANGKEVAIYISIFLVLLGIWCLMGYLFVKQKYVLKIMQKYVHMVLPFLYFGLGIYIIVNSECYPWSIDKINNSTSSNIGSIIMPIITSVLLILFIILIFWFRHSQSMRNV